MPTVGTPIPDLGWPRDEGRESTAGTPVALISLDPEVNMPRVTKKPQSSRSDRKSVRPPTPIPERTVPTGIPEIDHGKVKTEGVVTPEAERPAARRLPPSRRQGARHGA